MALTNYSDLKTTVANYLARSDLTSQIPDFIRLAEDRLRRELRIRQMLKVVTTTTTSGDSTISLPSDFLQLRDIHIDGSPVSTVTYQSPSAFFRNARTAEAGIPVFYTILASEFQFAPIPDSNYTVRMLYYAAPPYLSDSNSSNMFLANCVDALLYSTLAEAEPYLMNDARLATWASLYDRAINAITTSDDQGEYSASPIAISVATR
jgi:hypothetical protein